MRKNILLLLFTVTFFLSGCSKNDEYDINMLHGVWKLSSFESSVKPTDVKSINLIVFKPDGTYYTSGILGNYSGTYDFESGIITAYSEKDECLKFEVLSLLEMECKFKVHILNDSSTAIIKCRRALDIIK